MILSLLERLEQEGGARAWRPGGLGANLRSASATTGQPGRAPIRWYRSAATGSTGVPATTSGRVAAATTLRAERTDDGVFVASSSVTGGERIVWVGDLELECATRAAAEFLAPSFDFHADGLGLELTWKAARRAGKPGGGAPLAFRMRLTLPCRPIGELTFRNDDLDGEVWLSATRDGRMAARMRPYAALPELEIAPGSGELAFEPDPDWRLGVEVMESDGSLRVEDRFSPGVFLLQLPEGERAVRLSIRIVPVTEAQRATEDQRATEAERGQRGGALGSLMGQLRSDPGAAAAAAAAASVPVRAVPADDVRLAAMVLPGQLALGKATTSESESESALRELLIAAAEHVSGPRFDVALWAARAAFLIAPGPTRDVTSVTLPFLRGVVGRIERDHLATGCPGAAAAGLPRWCSPSDSFDARQIPIEYAALLHQSCQHAADLATFQGERDLTRRARSQARHLRRWFQRAYWLPRPDRAADLAFLDAESIGQGHDAHRGQKRGMAPETAAGTRVRALCLRPHMLLAASFEGAPLSRAQRRVIVRVTEARLLVPSLGIATLDCDDIEFHGHSGQNGAIWPFLIASFVEASLRAFGPDRGRHRMLAELVHSQALRTAPMAWAHSAGRSISPMPYLEFEPIHSHRHPMPIGPLHFELNAAEGARAMALLSGTLSACAIPPDYDVRAAETSLAFLRS
ncbi:Amylo-alpha-1,6-glucosidase [Planctomycetes bacterium Poly30]|uniref:Amylo-alpha-1,6-glucosidase n=1 Tax=Saltatorellus ferox TaxID=2528018 RepID=A0A518ETU4_9BACT|nr:Amylo-alpha-1,6-glucosidase [Planctomycetes bacterium Poly30]